MTTKSKRTKGQKMKSSEGVKKRKKASMEAVSNDSSTDDGTSNTFSMFGAGTSLPPAGSLISSIFGNSATQPEPSKATAVGTEQRQAKPQSASLMSSIFGNGDEDRSQRSPASREGQESAPSKKKRSKKDKRNKDTDVAVTASAGFDLFSSSASFQQVSQKRQEEIRKKQRQNMQKQHQKNQRIILPPDAVLDRRRKRTATTGDLVASVTVDVQPYCEPTGDSRNEDSDEEDDDMEDGVARLLVGRSSALFRQQGVLILKSLLSKNATKKKPKKTTASSLIQQMQSKARNVELQVCERLNEKLGEESYRPTAQPNEKAGKDNDRSFFRFEEVASRCLGRLDIRYGMNEAPFTNLHLPTALRDNPMNAASSSLYDNNVVKLLWPLVQDLLGKDAELVYMGLICSFPGSEDQPWHQDGTTLFADAPSDLTNSLPPYALNVFIPLLDITEELGPTEFWLGSHVTDQAQDFLSSRQKGNGRDPDDDENDSSTENNTAKPQIIGPLLSVGDALIYDYRICHRGTSNLSSNATTRPMLYLMYARPWFKEHLNFGNEHLFDSE